MSTAPVARAPAPRVSPPPLSLYVHLPWCVRKCPYCDFNSYEARGALPEAGYVDALLRDLDIEAPAAGGREIGSIFVGGGTPSLFSAAAVARLLDGVRARVRLTPDAEITLEANPGASEAGRFADYRHAGVNRLSIGVQSFRDPQLLRLGRVHDAAQAEQAVHAAAAAGFDNVNLDLMYGLPGDDLAGALADLDRAIALQPAHLSWYHLTLEANTAFERRPPRDLPDDELVAAVEEQGRGRLAAAGYERYEISAYARPGRRCAHNLGYWQFDDYLGIGAGAHGKLTLPDGTIERRSKARNPRSYVAAAGTTAAVAVERVVEPDAVALEFLMNALRLVAGVSTAAFEERTGLPAGIVAGPVAEARRRGWLAGDAGELRATPTGFAMLNSLLRLF